MTRDELDVLLQNQLLEDGQLDVVKERILAHFDELTADLQDRRGNYDTLLEAFNRQEKIIRHLSGRIQFNQDLGRCGEADSIEDIIKGAERAVDKETSK